jgi:hypothetical protein
MTVPTRPPETAEHEAEPAPDEVVEASPLPQPFRSAVEAVAGTCPYLGSASGAWRAVAPSRDHRCNAVDPPAAQTTEKQRRHCISADHVDCPLYRAARSARAMTLAAGADIALVEAADRRRRPVARTAPILLEPPRLVDQAMRLQLERAPGQIALIGLMVVAFLIVAVARLSGGSGPTPDPSILVPRATASASATSRPTPLPSSAVGPSASVPASAAATRTYTVKKGDTLVAIATKFQTTAAKIKALNGLKSSTLHVGQVLSIP